MEQQVIENKEAKEKRNTPLFVLKIVGNVIFYFIIIVLLLLSIMNIRAGNQSDAFPNIFGKGFLSVQTDSMNGDKDDSFKAGDLLFVKVFKEKKANHLKVNDVITFYDSTVNDNKGGLNSHRIVYINYDAEGNVLSVVCQGDKSAKDYNWTFNPESTDSNAPIRNQELLSGNHAQTVSLKDIKGVMTSIWHGAGKTVDGIQKNWLFIFVLPVLAFLIFEIFMVAKNVMALKNEKKGINNDNVIDIEAQKEELRAQILAELRAEQGLPPVEENKAEAPTEEEDDSKDESEETPVESNESELKEEQPAEEPVAEEAPTEEPVVEETPVVEEQSVEEPVAAEEPKEESVVEEEPVVSETPKEEPVAEEQPVKKTTTKKPAASKTSTAKKTTSTAAKKPAAKASTTKKTTSTAAKKPAAKAST
ncbi:MAG: hypothetical protein K2O05_01875, partial [Anaeroplasmataceae bacterium]|nr:hypothetical protein [Anaeroplasmataceae bacterium]